MIFFLKNFKFNILLKKQVHRENVQYMGTANSKHIINNDY